MLGIESVQFGLAHHIGAAIVGKGKVAHPSFDWNDGKRIAIFAEHLESRAGACPDPVLFIDLEAIGDSLGYHTKGDAIGCEWALRGIHDPESVDRAR